MAIATFDGTLENESARNVTPLVTLFRCELRALDAYTMLLEHPALRHHGELLRQEKAHHADRALALLGRMRELSTKVPPSEGAWDSIATLAAATVLARRSTLVATLCDEEEILFRDYERAMSVLDTISRRLVGERLLPTQARTLRAVTTLLEDANEM